jgi:hypothetical protein
MNAVKMKIVEPYLKMQDFLKASHIGRHMDGGVDALRQRIEAEGDGRIKPIRLPWPDTNRSLGHGLTPGEVTIIAGSAGVAKSYLLLNILRHAGENGVRWRLLPMEDSGDRWVLRMLAAHCCQWRLVAQSEDDRPETLRRDADEKLAMLREHEAIVKQWGEAIFENPRRPVDNGAGGLTVRDVHYRDVLTFLEDIAGDCDLVGIDCLSQISFSDSSDGRDFIGQGEFMRGVVGVAAATGCHFALVGHHAKGAPGRDPLDSIQGSAMFQRLAHNVISLTRHDPAVESEVLSRFDPVVEHRLTLSILKSRGGLSGTRVAMDLDSNGPQFVEYGRITSKPKGGRK